MLNKLTDTVFTADDVKKYFKIFEHELGALKSRTEDERVHNQSEVKTSITSLLCAQNYPVPHRRRSDQQLQPHDEIRKRRQISKIHSCKREDQLQSIFCAKPK